MTDGEAGKAVSLVATDCRDAECELCQRRKDDQSP